MPAFALNDIPYIDETVEYVGVSRLRSLNASSLLANEKTLVIEANKTPVAVLLAYEKFLCMQREMEAMQRTIELFSDDDERKLLIEGFGDLVNGRTKGIEAIRNSLVEDH